MSKIRDNQVIVLSGETGCGKTTQVLLYVVQCNVYVRITMYCVYSVVCYGVYVCVQC